MRKLSAAFHVLMTMLVGMALAAWTTVEADTITLRADSWCPYNCQPGSDFEGYLIEVVREVFAKKGHTVDYQLLNWAQSIKETKEGKFNGIVGAYKEDAPDFIFPRITFTTSTQKIFTLPKSKWSFTGIKSLAGQKIGVVKNYSYDEATDAFIKNKNPAFVVLSGDDVQEKMISLLQKKQLTAIYEDPTVIAYSMKKMKVAQDGLRKANDFYNKEAPVYIAFSPVNPKSREYADILAQGFADLRKSGRIDELKTKYSVK